MLLQKLIQKSVKNRKMKLGQAFQFPQKKGKTPNQLQGETSTRNEYSEHETTCK